MTGDRVALTLRMERQQHNALRRLSFEYRLPINEIIRRAVGSLLSSDDERDFLLAEEPDHG